MTTSTQKITAALAIIGFSLTLGASVATAREGARSVGKGMKCYTAATQTATGVQYKQVCYKSV